MIACDARSDDLDEERPQDHALVTGANKGIGLETVRRLLDAGFISEAGLACRRPVGTGSGTGSRREPLTMNASTDTAATFGSPAPVLSYSPVVLSVPGRHVDLQVRVSAPATGTGLPVILLSHGHGGSNNLSSLNGYAPIANLWAAAGFAVIQPMWVPKTYATRRYSRITPPARSRRWTRNRSRSATLSGSGRSGAAWRRVRWGR